MGQAAGGGLGRVRADLSGQRHTKGANIKGLRGRWLAQDAGDKDTGFAVSLWDNLYDMQVYEQSPLYREIMAPLQPFFVGEYKTYRCEVKYTDLKP